MDIEYTGHNGILNLTRLKIILFFMPDGFYHTIYSYRLCYRGSPCRAATANNGVDYGHNLQALMVYSLPESVVITVANKSLLKEKRLYI